MILKTIGLSCAFLLLARNLESQQHFDSYTSIGINAGADLCNVSFNPPINQNLLLTTSAGLVFRHVSEPHIGTQLELNYAGRGWIENRDSLGRYRRNLKVLDIPLTAAFIAGKKAFRVAVTLGPYTSYILSDKEQIEITDAHVEPNYYRIVHGNRLFPEDRNPNYQGYYTRPLFSRWEFGFTGGLAIEVYSKLGILGIRGSYYHGLTNIFPLNVKEFYYNGSRTQVIHIGLTYSIKI
jgi:hypothetical protein